MDMKEISVVCVILLAVVCSVYMTHVMMNNLEVGTLVKRKHGEPYIIWKHRGFMRITQIGLYILSVALPILTPIVFYVTASRHGAYGKVWKFNHPLFEEV